MAKTVKRNFPVVGLGCAACVNRVENTLKDQKGVRECSVSLAANNAQVEYDPEVVRAADLKRAVQNAGYDLIIQDDSDEIAEDAAKVEEEAEEMHRKYFRRLKTDMWLAIILAVALFIVQMGFIDFEGKGWVLLALAAISVFWCGRRFHKGAILQLKHKSANMDTLVSLSTLISFLFSLFNLIFPKALGEQGALYFDSAALITAFILIGRVLEEQAKYGTTKSIRKLYELRPKKTRASVGETIKIKPGQRIDVDGIVLAGSSFVDESLLTGEPLPCSKHEGNQVFAGTMNQDGLLQVQVTKTGNDTLLSRIIAMVSDAQGSKAKVQKTVDKVAAIFVPAVLLIAIITLIYWLVAPDGNLAKALLSMVSVLVIACPLLARAGNSYRYRCSHWQGCR